MKCASCGHDGNGLHLCRGGNAVRKLLERKNTMINLEYNEDLLWESDWAGDEVGHPGVEVVGLYSLAVNPNIYFYIDITEGRVLEVYHGCDCDPEEEKHYQGLLDNLEEIEVKRTVAREALLMYGTAAILVSLGLLAGWALWGA